QAGDVDVVHVLPVLGIGVEHRSRGEDTGDVREMLDRSVLGFDALDDVGDSIVVADVDGVGGDGAAEQRGGLAESFGVAVGEHETVTGAREGLGGRAADALRGPDDERDGGRCGLGHRSTPSASRTVPNLTVVSASSSAGSESATMPPPAWAVSPIPSASRTAQRMVTIHSPSPAASHHPTAPA